MRVPATLATPLEETLWDVRRQTLALVDDLDDEALHAPVAPILGPLVWDLGHIAAYEDLWAVHRLGRLPLLRPELAALYDAFETPRAVRGDVALLRRDDAHAYLEAVRERALAVLARTGPDDLHELVLRHELQHAETMRQALFLRSLPGGVPEPDRMAVEPAGWVAVDGGAGDLGAPAEGFAYDNERPRHRVALEPFAIASAPVSTGEWRTFVAAGGYARREWWSDAGWSWRCRERVCGPLAPAGAAPGEAVAHVSWYEAQAYARSRSARLPTEAEWEHAAVTGAIGSIGLVWEWTATEFAGYSGFRAHPYREYSEVFFGRGHRVLRGGSWATSARVATSTFRNWDRPERRQIFSGLRLARDA
jgi:gamma-glutamyl hercynylcysteine S-oxide synthase